MGIRIKKILGYGFADLLHEGRSLKDPRIDIEALHTRHDLHAKDFLAFLEAYDTTSVEYLDKIDINFTKKRIEEDPGFFNRILFYDDEYGLANVLLFSVPGFKDWCRYDDMIDYMEETRLKRDGNLDLEPRVDVFDVPLYPFLNWMDKNTGKKLNREENDSAFAVARCLSSKIRVPDELEHIAKKMTPDIPMGVRLLVEFSKICPVEHIKDLRPMLYTYWS